MIALEFLILSIFFLSYLAFAIFFIKSTWNTSSKIQRTVVLGFFILLPSWDYVLGCALYYASWPFFPKIAVYEKAEVDGIYYEGAHRKKVMCVSGTYLGKHRDVYLTAFSSHDMEKGYKYSEELIEKGETCPYLGGPELPTLPAVFRCVPLPTDPKNPKYIYTQCDPVETILSGYAVKLNSFKIGSFEMNTMSILNRTTGQLMAEYKEIVRWGHLPFFCWLLAGEFGGGGSGGVRHSKPQQTLFYDFQYEVLKLKSSP